MPWEVLTIIWIRCSDNHDDSCLAMFLHISITYYFLLCFIFSWLNSNNIIGGDIMDSGIYIFEDREEFLKFMKELEKLYSQNDEN